MSVRPTTSAAVVCSGKLSMSPLRELQDVELAFQSSVYSTYKLYCTYCTVQSTYCKRSEALISLQRGRITVCSIFDESSAISCLLRVIHIKMTFISLFILFTFVAKTTIASLEWLGDDSFSKVTIDHCDFPIFNAHEQSLDAVSYTHLTLPTICSV